MTRAPLVESDLTEIWLYIARDNPTAADALLDRVDAACRILARSPRAGRSRLELGDGVRSHAVGRYTIYDRRVSGGIELIRVLSSYRDVTSML